MPMYSYHIFFFPWIIPGKYAIPKAIAFRYDERGISIVCHILFEKFIILMMYFIMPPRKAISVPERSGA